MTPPHLCLLRVLHANGQKSSGVPSTGAGVTSTPQEESHLFFLSSIRAAVIWTVHLFVCSTEGRNSSLFFLMLPTVKWHYCWWQTEMIEKYSVTDQQRWWCKSNEQRKSRPRKAAPYSPPELRCRQTPGRATCPPPAFSALSTGRPPAWGHRSLSGHQHLPPCYGPKHLRPVTDLTPELWHHRASGGLTEVAMIQAVETSTDDETLGYFSVFLHENTTVEMESEVNLCLVVHRSSSGRASTPVGPVFELLLEQSCLTVLWDDTKERPVWTALTPPVEDE